MNFITNDKTGVSEGFCLIKTCDKKQTARGVPYLDLVLADQSGEISAKLWDYKEEAQGTFAANDLVKVRGRIDVYNGADQLRIDRIRKVVPSDNVQISDYVPSAAYDGAWMLSEIRSLVVAFENTDLKELVTELLDEYEEKLLYWPAAFKLHHAIRGGLLCHTLSIVRLAQGVCHVYPFIDQELLLSGAILHDIAKIEEFTVSSTGIASGYTSQGMLIGHLASGTISFDGISRFTPSLMTFALGEDSCLRLSRERWAFTCCRVPRIALITSTSRITMVLSVLPENMEIAAAMIRITTSRSAN
ncbi:MAG: TraI domain-containing protein [Acutalibacteraceae bacterium]